MKRTGQYFIFLQQLTKMLEEGRTVYVGGKKVDKKYFDFEVEYKDDEHKFGYIMKKI